MGGGGRRRSLLRIIHARGAIPNEMGPTRCRATPALNQSADEIRTPALPVPAVDLSSGTSPPPEGWPAPAPRDSELGLPLQID